MNGGGSISRPPFGSAAKASIERTSSTASRKGALTVCTASVRAAGSIEARKLGLARASSGLKTITTRTRRGAASLSNSSHLPPTVDSLLLNPVVLPSGRRMGRAVTLCSFESPLDIQAGRKWCHRHLAAKWLDDQPSIEVEEIGHPELDRFAFL